MKQHWIVKLKGHRRDEVLVEDGSVTIVRHKHWRPSTSMTKVSINKIESIIYPSKSFLGWLLGYSTIILDMGDERIRVDYLRKVDVEQFKKEV